MKKYFKSRNIMILALLILAGFFAYSKYYAKPKIQYTTAKVQRGTLKQTVTETGVIRHASEVNLNFLAQGRIASSSVRVGSKVTKGKVLAELDYSNQRILARQAQASLDIAIANEQKILRGAAYSDVNIAQTSVIQAQVGFENAKKDLIRTAEADIEAEAQAQKTLSDLTDRSVNTPAEASVNSAQVSLDKNLTTYQKTTDNRVENLLIAIHDKISVAKNSLDNVNRVLTDDNAKDTLSIKDLGRLASAKNNYLIAQSLAQQCAASYAEAAKTRAAEDAKNSSDLISRYLSTSIVALNDTFDVLDNSIVSSKFTQAQLDAFKSSISGQITLANAGLTALAQARQALDDATNNYDAVIANSREALNIAKTNLSNATILATNTLNNARLAKTRNFQSAKARVDAAQESLNLAKAQLAKTTANSRPEDISLVQAQVRQAQANLDGAINQINNSIIKAPFDGQITQANYEIGESPGASQPVFVLMGENQFEIEIDIAESDIAKIAIGNSVSVDFDAFGSGIIFSGKVERLDPAQTVIQEVVYYKGIIGHLTTGSSTQHYLQQIKSGMTANTTIMANQKDNVLMVPYRAVADKAGIRTVDVLRNGQPVTLAVSLGLRGDDGLVEVLSGLAEPDMIILSHTP